MKPAIQYMMKIMTIICLLVIGLILPSNSVNAESKLPLNGTTNGKLTAHQELVYAFTLSKSGKLTLDLKSFSEEADFQLIDDQENEIMDLTLQSDGKTATREVKNYHLEPRNYRLFIKDDSYSGRTGSFVITTTFKESNASDIEPNNGTSEAQLLTFGKKTRGFISEQDDRDVYKISVPRGGRLTLDTSSYVKEGANLSLVDAYNEEIWNKYLRSTELTPGKENQSIYLEKGDYYFFVDRGYPGYTGIYEVNATFKAANNNEVEPNNGSIEAKNLAFYKKITGLLSWNDTDDYYKITIPKKSNVTLDFSSYIDVNATVELINAKNENIFYKDVWGKINTPGRLIQTWSLNKGTYYLRVHNNYYNGIYQFQVKSSHLLPTLSVKPVKTSSTTVSGATEKNASVTTKIGKKTYKTKANAKGQFNIKISKQKAGTQIKIYSTNQYGTTYKTTKVTK
ncbi:Ig-like domain-containing protein [Exiguobacterium antarcticum]|uniref:Ig-like domain-containing protein n=1 Tax=Exiguobacterium antarcticum TaxID=132920 RepID=UPI00047D9287|nr:Ig-like domain-containing protein [Exiguobacterium antarcticum]